MEKEAQLQFSESDRPLLSLFHGRRNEKGRLLDMSEIEIVSHLGKFLEESECQVQREKLGDLNTLLGPSSTRWLGLVSVLKMSRTYSLKRKVNTENHKFVIPENMGENGFMLLHFIF